MCAGAAFISAITAKLTVDLREHAPGITLRFLPESLEDRTALR